MINKSKYRVDKDKKVLHKVGKQWKVISVALLMAIGGGAVVAHHVNADTVSNHQSNPQQTRPTMASQASSVAQPKVQQAQPSSAVQNTNLANQKIRQISQSVAQPSVQSAPISTARTNVSSASSQNIENRAQALHAQVQNSQKSNVIPEDRPINKTADNTISFNNDNSFTPFHFATHNSPVQQQVVQRNRWNFTIYGKTTLLSDEDLSPIKGAYYSPRDNRFHVGTKPLNNDTVKSYGGLEGLDYTETKNYNPSDYTKSSIGIDFTDGVMPNGFNLNNIQSPVNHKTQSIQSDISNADKITFSSDIDTSQVKDPAGMRNYLLNCKGVSLPSDFLVAKHPSYELEVNSAEDILHSAESDSYNMDNSADIADDMNAQIAQVNPSDYENSSEISSVFANDRSGYSRIVGDSSAVNSNYKLINEDMNDILSASADNDGSSVSMFMNNANSASSQIKSAVSDMNSAFKQMSFVNYGNKKVTDNVIFNGDKNANYSIHGFNTNHQNVSAPNGYHFTDGKATESITLNNGKHTFSVVKDIDYNLIKNRLNTAQTNVKALNNIIDKATEQSKVQSQNAKNADRYMNGEQLINANNKDNKAVDQINDLLSAVKSDYSSIQNNANDLNQSSVYNDQSKIDQNLGLINDEENKIKDNLSQANMLLNKISVIKRGDPKVTKYRISYRYDGNVVKHYLASGDIKGSYSNNVPKGYYIKDINEQGNDIVVNLGQYSAPSSSSNVPVPVAPIKSGSASSSAKSSFASDKATITPVSSSASSKSASSASSAEPSSAVVPKSASAKSSASAKPKSKQQRLASKASSAVRHHKIAPSSAVAPKSSSAKSNSVAPSSSASQSITPEEESLQEDINKLELKVQQLTKELEQTPKVSHRARRIRHRIRRHGKHLPTIKIDQLNNKSTRKVSKKAPKRKSGEVRYVQIRRPVMLHRDAYSVGSNHYIAGSLGKTDVYVRVVGLTHVKYYDGSYGYRYEIMINGHLYFITASDIFVRAIR